MNNLINFQTKTKQTRRLIETRQLAQVASDKQLQEREKALPERKPSVPNTFRLTKTKKSAQSKPHKRPIMGTVGLKPLHGLKEIAWGPVDPMPPKCSTPQRVIKVPRLDSVQTLDNAKTSEPSPGRIRSPETQFNSNVTSCSVEDRQHTRVASVNSLCDLKIETGNPRRVVMHKQNVQRPSLKLIPTIMPSVELQTHRSSTSMVPRVSLRVRQSDVLKPKFEERPDSPHVHTPLANTLAPLTPTRLHSAIPHKLMRFDAHPR